MRTLLFTMLLAAMCITADAQTADTMLTNKFLLNFAVPDMPAAKALGTDASGLLRPSDVQKFAASFQPFYSGGQGVIPKNFAVEFAPWKLASRHWTLSDYNKGIKSFLYNSAFSVATVRDTSSYASKLSIGYHLTIGTSNSDILKAVFKKNRAIIDVQEQMFTMFDVVRADWIFYSEGVTTDVPADSVRNYTLQHRKAFVTYLQNMWAVAGTNPVKEVIHTLATRKDSVKNAQYKELMYKDSLEKAYCRCLFVKDSLIQVYSKDPAHKNWRNELCCICTGIKDTLQRLYYTNITSVDLPEKICCKVAVVNTMREHGDDVASRIIDSLKVLHFRKFIDSFGISTKVQFDSLMNRFTANDPVKFIADSVDHLINHWKDSMWNAGRWDIALAYTAASKDTLIKNAQFSSFNLWVTKACQISNWGQLLLGGSLALPRTEKNDTVTTNTSFTLNARLYAGSNSIKGFFETQYQYQNYSGYKKALLFNLGAEFTIAQHFWVVASAGINNYLGLSNPLGVLVSGISLRYGFNKPK